MYVELMILRMRVSLTRLATPVRSSACYEQAAIVVLDANDNDPEDDDECVMPQDS
jgi:hypothetical protein